MDIRSSRLAALKLFIISFSKSMTLVLSFRAVWVFFFSLFSALPKYLRWLRGTTKSIPSGLRNPVPGCGNLHTALRAGYSAM